MGGVAQQGDARNSVPPVGNRQGIDCAKNGGSFPICDECGELRGVAGLAKWISAIHSGGLESATYT